MSTQICTIKNSSGEDITLTARLFGNILLPVGAPGCFHDVESLIRVLRSFSKVYPEETFLLKSVYFDFTAYAMRNGRITRAEDL